MVVTLALVSFIGCATRGSLGEDSWLTPAADLYSRNWIVAAPTLAGNIACGAVGVPIYLVMGAFGKCQESNAAAPDSCNWASRNMGHALVIPGVACGAVTGAPFLPLALLCPEDPVQLKK